MRPTSQSQSALRAPLNHILGTEASVRVLRVLTTSVAPLSLAEIARRAALRPTSVTLTVRRLTELGLVEPVGVGTGRLVQLRREHPLTPAITALFEAEAARVQRIHDGIKQAAQRLPTPPEAIWIEGPVAKGQDQIGDAVTVRLVAPAWVLAELRDAFRSALGQLERSEEVTIDLHASTRADLELTPENIRGHLSTARLIYGLPPDVLLSTPAPIEPSRRTRRTHADADAEALVVARQVAEQLAEDPSLVSRARARLAQQMEHASPRLLPTLQEWHELLRTMSLARLRRFLVDPGERATRLRQSLPFVGLVQANRQMASRSRRHTRSGRRS